MSPLISSMRKHLENERCAELGRYGRLAGSLPIPENVKLGAGSSKRKLSGGTLRLLLQPL